MKYYLYRHIRVDTNLPFYIGVGTKINRKQFRSFRGEYSRAFSKASRNKHWKNIIKDSEYLVEILFESDDYNLILEKEVEFIERYGRRDIDTGILCNWTSGGEGVCGLVFSEEHRTKMSQAKIGKSTWGKGKTYTEEHRNNLRISHLGLESGFKGKKHSSETRQKMSIAAKQKVGVKNNFYGKNHTLEYKRAKGKGVDQFDREGEFVNSYYTLSEAAEQTNSDVRLISAVCLGKRKTHNSFFWKFKSSTTK